MSALIQALSKQEPKVHIDLVDKLSRRSLAGLPSCCLPDGDLVDDLATQASKLRKKGIKDPFINVDLAKYLPVWCRTGGELPSDDETEDNAQLRAIAKAMGAPAKPKHKFTILE